MTATQQLRQYVQKSANVVFFGGAGVSTESGIPDFRSEDGLYRQQYAYPPETILSASFFYQHTEEFFDFYRAKMLCLDAKPGAAHHVLAKWEKAGKLTAIVTQNIDGLHQAAGSQRVYELHGSVHRNTCQSCRRQFSAADILHSTGIPRCPCGGLIKPDVVLYEEALDPAVLHRSIQAIAAADLLLIGGTSLAVYPAAGLIEYFGGQHLVLINKGATAMDNRADLVIRDSIGSVLSSIS